MLHKWNLTIKTLSPDLVRRAYLYLPKAYNEKPDARFPVLYMFDGQNVFLDQDATFGTSWGMYDYMNETDTELIIAAVECSSVGNDRLREYSPFSHSDPGLGRIDALGRTYMDWLVGSFKPMIDRRFRTLPDREHTLIAGSSMGGLMSLYACGMYNEVFSRAACLSPSLWVDPAKVRNMLKRSRFAPDTVLYLSYGEDEMGNHDKTPEALLAACQSLFGKGVNLTFRVVPDGSHCEASWREQIPVMMKCLGF